MAVLLIMIIITIQQIGDFLVEYIFVWNGIGQYAFQAVLAFDYPAILGTTIVVAIMYVAVNLVVDIIQSFLDPRIVLGRKEG